MKQAIQHYKLLFSRTLIYFVFRACLGLAWDNDGELLAIIQANSAVVLLWDKNTRKSSSVDMDIRGNLPSLVFIVFYVCF